MTPDPEDLTTFHCPGCGLEFQDESDDPDPTGETAICPRCGCEVRV